jgi:predicted nucleic acid-binding protein
MQIVDTVVLIAFTNREDPRHEKAREYAADIALRPDTFVPSAAFVEFDLDLKTHGFGLDARLSEHSRLQRLVPSSKVLPVTPGVLARATELSGHVTWRDSYFDTLIAATGLEFGVDSAITTDRKFAKLGIKPIF